MKDLIASLLQALEKYSPILNLLGTVGFAGFLHYAFSRFRERVRIRIHGVEIISSQYGSKQIGIELENISPTLTSLTPSAQLKAYSWLEERREKRGRSIYHRSKENCILRLANEERTLQPFSPAQIRIALPDDLASKLFLLRFPRIKLTTTPRKTVTVRMLGFEEGEKPQTLFSFWRSCIRQQPWRRSPNQPSSKSPAPEASTQTEGPS